jgi:hypothetical protein
MWERIVLSGVLTAGAIVLFVLFTAALIIYEKRSENRSAKNRATRHGVRKSAKPACRAYGIRRGRAA